MISSSCVATVFMLGYVLLALNNLYTMMYPLSRYKPTETVDEHQMVRPLWNAQTEQLAMKVYLSTRQQFSPVEFVRSDVATNDGGDDGQTNPEEEIDNTDQSRSNDDDDTVLLWKQNVGSEPSISKSILLTTTSGDPQPFAVQWLDDHDQSVLNDDGGLLSTIQAAGQGIESTSVLLTLYQTVVDSISNIVHGRSNSLDPEEDEIDNSITPKQRQRINREKKRKALEAARTTVQLSPSGPIWSHLQSNSTIYIHVVVVRKPQQYYLDRPTSPTEAMTALRQAQRAHSLLVGQPVSLVKHDIPTHIPKPTRILYHDLLWLFQRYVSRSSSSSSSSPPWDMRSHKPNEYLNYEMAQQMKVDGMGYSYWKPEVSIKYVMDSESYPIHLVHLSGMDVIRIPKTPTGSGFAHLPALHVDEIGLTSEKYIPVNNTVTSLPLHISFDRSDIDLNDVVDDGPTKTTSSSAKSTTATSGGISPARWRLLSQLSKSFESQKELGFEESDIDDLRRLIADTNVGLLGITVLASALHLLFEFLTFKNEVSFWSNNDDLTGLSVRSLFLDMAGQFIIVLYLIEMGSSLLMIVPSSIGVLIALWKCHRAAGFRFVRVKKGDNDKGDKQMQSSSFWNVIPRCFGYELRATRLEKATASSTSSSSAPPASGTNDKSIAKKPTIDLQAMTIEADRQATVLLGSLLLPLVIAYTVYSLIMEEHTSWYSWLIRSASSAVYAFGFVLMTPQLFLNYKLKSVAHLPWKVLCYKSLNTFIDDLFSFIIRMPTMARISCFRDDVVFFIYLYQRFIYHVDTSRPVEGGGDNPTRNDDGATDGETKKDQ